MDICLDSYLKVRFIINIAECTDIYKKNAYGRYGYTGKLRKEIYGNFVWIKVSWNGGDGNEEIL